MGTQVAALCGGGEERLELCLQIGEEGGKSMAMVSIAIAIGVIARWRACRSERRVCAWWKASGMPAPKNCGVDEVRKLATSTHSD